MLSLVVSFLLQALWLNYLGALEAFITHKNYVCRKLVFTEVCEIKDEHRFLKLNFFYLFDFLFPSNNWLINDYTAQYRSSVKYVSILFLVPTLIYYCMQKITPKKRRLIYLINSISLVNLVGLAIFELGLAFYGIVFSDPKPVIYAKLPRGEKKFDKGSKLLYGSKDTHNEQTYKYCLNFSPTIVRAYDSSHQPVKPSQIQFDYCLGDWSVDPNLYNAVVGDLKFYYNAHVESQENQKKADKQFEDQSQNYKLLKDQEDVVKKFYEDQKAISRALVERCKRLYKDLDTEFDAGAYLQDLYDMKKLKLFYIDSVQKFIDGSQSMIQDDHVKMSSRRNPPRSVQSPANSFATSPQLVKKKAKKPKKVTYDNQLSEYYSSSSSSEGQLQELEAYKDVKLEDGNSEESAHNVQVHQLAYHHDKY